MANLDELRARAWQHYQAGDRQQAERLCWEMLQQQPLHTDALYLLGVGVAWIFRKRDAEEPT